MWWSKKLVDEAVFTFYWFCEEYSANGYLAQIITIIILWLLKSSMVQFVVWKVIQIS